MSLWSNMDYSVLNDMTFQQALDSGLVVPTAPVWNSEYNRMDPSGEFVLAGTNMPVQYNNNTGGVVPVQWAPNSNTGGSYQSFDPNTGVVTTTAGGAWGAGGWQPGDVTGQTAWQPPSDSGGILQNAPGFGLITLPFAATAAGQLLGGAGATETLSAAGGGATAVGDVASGAAIPGAVYAGDTAATAAAAAGVVPWTAADTALLAGGAGALGVGAAGAVGAGAGLIPGLLSAATGLYGLNQAGKISSAANNAAAMADPFGSQRAQYFGALSREMATPLSVDPRYAVAASTANPVTSLAGTSVSQLLALMANPGGELSKIPGYQAGIDAVQRSLGAQGYQGSGNMMAALQQYGGQAYQQQFGNLTGLATLGGNAWQGDVANLAGLSSAEVAARQANISNLASLSGASFNPANAANLQFQGATTGANLALNSAGLLGKGITSVMGA